MKKNVLDEAVKLLGINEGDVIQITKPKGKNVYQYNNGVFTYLNGDKNSTPLGDDEIMDLIQGKDEYIFEIIAYGRNPNINEMTLERLSGSVDSIEDNVIEVLDKIKTKERSDAEQKEKDKKTLWITLGIWVAVLFLLIVFKK